MKKEIRKLVFEKYNGHCAYCGVELDFKTFQVDHLNTQLWSKDDSLDNLMPACAECDRYKPKWNIEVVREWLEKSKKQLLKTQNLRILHRLGGFVISDEPIKFYFER
jgi:CRISPR/Cas system Type II protein with McrA/HNH and RuvC-like nuclease domain